VIDRARENRLFARLSQIGFAPPYLGRFENGRVEGFLAGFRSLEPAEMGEDRWRRGIARTLAELHALPVDPPTPRTFDTLRGWLEQARDLHFNGPDAQRHADLDLPGALDRLDALAHTFSEALAPQARSPGAGAAVRPVLAHNDLLAGNVLVNPVTGAVRFIDYEYGDCGVAAFDVANHFCEYAGFDSDFERGFPGRARRHDFIAAYLGDGFSAEDVADFDRLVRFFVLVDHLWWGSWAVVQARYSPIDFDFMGYAVLRFAGLHFHTDRFGPTGAVDPA
jgi:ethanolamine kinase